jgi:hypothetical protein
MKALPTSEHVQAVASGGGDRVRGVWVWEMAGGLGQCPGIGSPDSKSSNAPTSMRVFGESAASGVSFEGEFRG